MRGCGVKVNYQRSSRSSRRCRVTVGWAEASATSKKMHVLASGCSCQSSVDSALSIAKDFYTYRLLKRNASKLIAMLAMFPRAIHVQSRITNHVPVQGRLQLAVIEGLPSVFVNTFPTNSIGHRNLRHEASRGEQ